MTFKNCKLPCTREEILVKAQPWSASLACNFFKKKTDIKLFQDATLHVYNNNDCNRSCQNKKYKNKRLGEH